MAKYVLAMDKWAFDRKFIPNMTEEVRAKNFKGWKKAVDRSLNWVDQD